MNYISIIKKENYETNNEYEIINLDIIDKKSIKHLIIDGTYLYIKKTNIGKFGICEIINDLIEDFIKEYHGKIFIMTKFNEILVLENKKKFIIEIENNIKNVWFCNLIKNKKFFNDHSLNLDFDDFYLSKFKFNEINIETVDIIYGRCVNSMTFLDGLYRDYVNKMKFDKYSIIGIKSVAGSGKTTTLLNLSKIHYDKKILYIAFNKSLIQEIKDKLKKENIKNMIPFTFDALMRNVYMNINNISIDDFSIIDLKPVNIGNFIPFFNNKPYKIKNYYIKNYNKFCNQVIYSNIKDFSINILGIEKPMLIKMWQSSINGEFITFDFIRKYCQIKNLCKNYIDNMFDMIFIDESQDFDNVMLKILLNDTNIPKLFVGDPKQAIYEWKGCINAFENLPKKSLIIEFYSTFRVGEPSCSEIRSKFSSCNMISKSYNYTILEYNTIPEENEKYVYLFRSWKNLLQNAQNLKKIWINNFDNQIEYMRKLHNKLKICDLDEDEYNEFNDDLPKFLLKLSAEELDKIINDITMNIVSKNDCIIQLYTIHTYKGLENDIVRIYNDIQLPKEENLYYVALTRGRKKIIIDIMKNNMFEENINNKKQKKIFNYGMNAIILK
jgi:hypothetical protein